MAPRPRKVSDDEVLAAAGRMMHRFGPAQLTLGHIADEVGVSSSALVQRFGSKRDLLLMLTSTAADHTTAEFARLRSEHPSPLETLRAYADCFAQMGSSPAALAHGLSYLQLDFVDEDFRANALAQAKASRAGIRKLLDEAVKAGELRADTDTRALARTVETVITGSLMMWGFYQQGTSAKWMRQDLDAVLEPFLAGSHAAARRRKAPERNA